MEVSTKFESKKLVFEQRRFYDTAQGENATWMQKVVR